MRLLRLVKPTLPRASEDARRLLIAATLIALLFAVASAAIVFGGVAHRKSQPGAGSIRQVEAVLLDRNVFFGDEVRARVQVIAPETSKVSVDADFSPYKTFSRSVQTEQLGGGVKRVRFDYTLTCLEKSCVIPKGMRGFAFDPITVRYGKEVERAEFPPLVVVSRMLTGTDGQLDRLTATPVRRDYEGPLSALAAAVLLLLAFLGLLALPRLSHAEGLPVEPVDEFELLMERLRAQTSVQVWAEQRAMLDALAIALEARGSKLAAKVASLAWGSQQPDPEQILKLLAQVEKEQKR